MKSLSRLLSAAALLCAIGASPSLAAVTALDVWADWQATAARYGQTVTAELKPPSDGVLTLTNVTTRMTSEAGATLVGTFPEVVLTETGDGAVRFTLPAVYTMQASTPGGEDGKAIETGIEVASTDMAVVATGDPGAVDYAYTASKVEIRTTDVTEDGKAQDMSAVVTLNDLSGDYATGSGTPALLTMALAADSATFRVEGEDPESEGGRIELSGEVERPCRAVRGHAAAVAGRGPCRADQGRRPVGGRADL